MNFNIIFILLILLLLFSLSIFITYIILNINKNTIKYYKPPTKILGKIQADIYSTYKFKERPDWTLYIPNGYNNIENELLDIKIYNKKRKFIFGINGCDKFVSKNGLWTILINKLGIDKASKIMPKSYLLYDKYNIDLFKKEYDSNELYILKKNIQRKEGLLLTSNINEILDGNKNGYRIVQKYMHNLFLVNYRKLNIRIYILIIFNKTPKFYIYNIGKCIYTNKNYNGNILDKESNITSYNLDYSIYNKSPFYTAELDKYILDKYKININIMVKIKKLMKSVCSAIKPHIYKSDNLKNQITFQLFGCDIILDDNFNPYILEFNKGPDMKYKSEKDLQLKYKLNLDIYNKLNLIYCNNNNFTLLI